MHCCPWWLAKQPGILEAGDVAYWSKDGNLSAFYNAARPMPVVLRQAVKAYEAGYSEGSEIRRERERKKREQAG